jgi:hypothetical protein
MPWHCGANALDGTKYPDFAGEWRKLNGVGGWSGVQWGQTEIGLARKAPLKPEFQASLEASLHDQTLGGQAEHATPACPTACRE